MPMRAQPGAERRMGPALKDWDCYIGRHPCTAPVIDDLNTKISPSGSPF